MNLHLTQCATGSCGQSAKLPYCDGTHQTLGFKPVQIRVNKDNNTVEIRARQEVVNEMAAKEREQTAASAKRLTVGVFTVATLFGVAATSLFSSSR
jgi:CDGSH-type Zn-finger protein